MLKSKLYPYNSRRKKEEFEYTKGATRVTSSSANSDEQFYTKNKPGKTGSYNVSPVPQHSRRAPSVASGEYDYPDPSFRGKRTTYYDNPAVIVSSVSLLRTCAAATSTKSTEPLTI